VEVDLSFKIRREIRGNCFCIEAQVHISAGGHPYSNVPLEYVNPNQTLPT